MNFSDPALWAKLWQIIIADILLAGDNALIIALATRALPAKQQFWGRMLGAGGAVVLRVIFVILIASLLGVPYLQLVGGLALLWISAKLVRPQAAVIEAAEEKAGRAVHAADILDEGVERVEHAIVPSHQPKVRSATTLREAIIVIIIADITMSFDNVVAIANIATDPITRQLHTGLVIFGLLFSIPLVVWGSQLIASLMEKHKWIIWFGGGVLGHVAATIIFKDPRVIQWFGLPPPPAEPAFVRYVAWTLAVLLFFFGWWSARRAAARPKPATP